ncbi:MAG: ion channel [Allosphingosinicella sp.]
MLTELFVATLMVLLTVTIHGIGIYALGRLFRRILAHHRQRRAHPLAPRSMVFMLGIALGLFVLHGTEIWAYSALYLATGAVGDLREAVYFSTMTYATLGYTDEGIDPTWKLVAAVEGVNGIILLGWSTAFFATVMARLGRS